jgi:RimJ/RimL family protein N-acetyltransferase
MIKSIWTPILTGQLIRLRPIAEGDFNSLYAVACDPELWKLHSEPNRYEEKVFRSFFDKALKSQGCLVIEDVKTGRVIGSSRFYEYVPDRKQVVIGYTFLERAVWGGVYNKELKRLMLDYAFQHVETVLFHTSDSNLISQRALAKLGARKRKGLIDLPGIGLRIEYSLSKEDWQSLRGES